MKTSETPEAVILPLSVEDILTSSDNFRDDIFLN